MITVPDRMDRAQHELTTNPISFAEFRTELEGLYQPPMVAMATSKKMASALKELGALGVESTADLTVTLVTRVVAARPPGESAYTTYGHLAVLQTICRYAEAAGYTRVNPFRLRALSRWIRRPKLEGRRHLTREEIRRVLDLAKRHIAERTGWAQWRARRLLIVIAIVAYCGLRKMECLRLHVDDVDLAARVIYIRGHGRALKTAMSEQPIPIPPALLPLLVDWLAHRMDAPFGYPIPNTCEFLIPTLNRKAAWTSGQPGGKALDRFRAVAKLAGVEGATFQMLRRSWATHAEALMGPAMIARILRHTTTRTSEVHYRRADVANMLEATKDFDF